MVYILVIVLHLLQTQSVMDTVSAYIDPIPVMDFSPLVTVLLRLLKGEGVE